jgi:hypothetical protein
MRMRNQPPEVHPSHPQPPAGPGQSAGAHDKVSLLREHVGDSGLASAQESIAWWRRQDVLRCRAAAAALTPEPDADQAQLREFLADELPEVIDHLVARALARQGRGSAGGQR